MTSGAEARRRWHRRGIIHGVAIVLATVIAYSGSLDGGFVSDDLQSVHGNPLLQSLGWTNVKAIFTSFDGANYMPLKVLSLAIDYRLWRGTIAGYHVTNLLLHALAAIVICTILVRMKLPREAAWLVATIWAVHPVNVESVAWISERKNVLSGVFFFAAFRVYLDFSDDHRPRGYAAVLILYLCALLSKMNTMVLPAICLAYETTARFRLRTFDVAASLPMFALAAFVGWYNLAGNPIHGGDYHGGSAIVTWLSTTVVIFRYLDNLIWPVGLTPHYAVTLHGSLLDPPVLLSTLALLAIVAVFFVLVRRRDPAAFWILWFFIALAPMLNIIPFRSLMQDRYMYLPMVGPLALGASWVEARIRTALARRLATVISAVMMVACVWLTRAQVEIWSSNLTLYQAEAPRLAFIGAHPPYRTPDQEERIAFMRTLVDRAPSATALNNLAMLHYSRGENDAAIAELERAAELDPDNPRVMLGLGRAYGRAGRLTEARDALDRAARGRPYEFLPLLDLAIVNLELGDQQGARQALEGCERLRPRIGNLLPRFTRERALWLGRRRGGH